MPDSPYRSSPNPSPIPAETPTNVVPFKKEETTPHRLHDAWTVYPPTYMTSSRPVR